MVSCFIQWGASVVFICFDGQSLSSACPFKLAPVLLCSVLLILEALPFCCNRNVPGSSLFPLLSLGISHFSKVPDSFSEEWGLDLGGTCA